MCALDMHAGGHQRHAGVMREGVYERAIGAGGSHVISREWKERPHRDVLE